MNRTHWLYFLSIEKDVENLARYIEFSLANFNCYSIEIARLLMSSTQEIDVLLKQICAHHHNSSTNETGYRQFILNQYPNMNTIKVELPKYDLSFIPFQEWQNNVTPAWWTANNKVKHQRHSHFSNASLENLLKSVSALFLTNLYFYAKVVGRRGTYPGAVVFDAPDLVSGRVIGGFEEGPQFSIP
jgi:hypothetical protein